LGSTSLKYYHSLKIDYQHGKIIHHDLEDTFLRKKSAKDDNFKFFEFISPTISTWVQHVLQGMLKLISTRTLEDFFMEAREHGVCVCLDDGGAPTN